MGLEFSLRLVGMLVFTLLGALFGINVSDALNLPPDATGLTFSLMGALVGLIVTPWITSYPARTVRGMIVKMPAETLVTSMFGLLVGMAASAMFAYAFAKAHRMGLAGPEYRERAERALRGLVERLVSVDEGGRVELHQICYVAGLGGVPYRSGTFEYYITEPIVTNDDKGVGPFILASVELEM